VIAEHNIRQNRTVDLVYLGTSRRTRCRADRLAPAARLRAHGSTSMAAAPDDWRGWNLGRERAREIIADDLSHPQLSCS
jgi:hypothetical protein